MNSELMLIKKQFTLDDFLEVSGIKLYSYQKEILKFLINHKNFYYVWSGIRSGKYWFNSIYEITKYMLENEEIK